MKERPIIFSAPMVRALLDGSKTQTRRVVKARKCPDFGCEMSPGEIAGDEHQQRLCPYGQPGDRLWVRENFQPFSNDDWFSANWKTGENCHCTYPATDGIQEFMDYDDNLRSTVKPSIHMPRWASRITLEITGARVERLQDISEADAIAEGIDVAQANKTLSSIGTETISGPVAEYSVLWEQINGPSSWDENPWVWVIEFRRI